MTADPQKVRSIFLTAVENYAPDQWSVYLSDACAGDQALRNRVEVLLRAHGQANSLLDAAGQLPTAMIDSPGREGPGAVIGQYKLLQEIGEGGMGTVFMAEQTHPVQRTVALKIIKPGMDSRQVVARFEAERQALALMDHPNIAKVLDAGTTDVGLPYFVMELVKGVPITKYCDEHRLTPRERLELFVPVCQAVQHAHQKGIIHRDLKPSNVLIALYDSKPVAKVIDFGVAKATGQRLTDRTFFTDFGLVVGTLEYMSPEQAELNNQEIDTRSDIYALGVVLYELLTGTTPLERRRCKEAALVDVLRFIREEEPPRPSTRLSTTEELPSIAANRGLEPKKLSGLVRGDLDWIVMKCLEKERNRRYETANGLARDLERHLRNEPVQARPTSAGYRLQKFLRRNKRGAFSVAVVLSALGVVSVTLAGNAVWSAQQRASQRAEMERTVGAAVAQAQALLEEGNTLTNEPHRWQTTLRLAKRAIERAEALVGARATPQGLIAPVRQVQAAMDQASKEAQLLVDLEQAQTLMDIGRSDSLDYDSGHHAYAQALGRFGLDVLAEEPGAVAAAIRRARPAIQGEIIGYLDAWAMLDRDANTRSRLWTLVTLVDDDAWRARLRTARRDGDLSEIKRSADEARGKPLPAKSFILLARDLQKSFGVVEAVALLRQARRQHPADFQILFTLAELLSSFSPSAKNPAIQEEATGCYWTALAVRPGNVATYINLGIQLHEKGDLDAALACYNEAISRDASVAKAYYSVGWLCEKKGETESAQHWYRKVLSLKPTSAEDYYTGGLASFQLGELENAITHFRQAVALDARNSGASHSLVHALLRRGDHAAAAVAAEQLAIYGHGEDWNDAANYLVQSADLARKDGKLSQAQRAMAIQTCQEKIEDIHVRENEVLANRAAADPANPSKRRLVAGGHWRYAEFFERIGRPEPATKALRQHEAIIEQLAAEFPKEALYRKDLIGSRSRLAMLFEGAARCDEAAKWHNSAVHAAEQLEAAFPEPGNRQLLVTRISEQGHFYTRLSQYQKAVAAEERVREIQPDNNWPPFNIPANMVLASDRDGYRRACGDGLRRLGDGKQLFAVFMVVRACGLAPDAVADPTVPEQAMAQIASADPSAVNLFVLGLAHYRAGQWDQAIARFEQSIKAEPAWHEATVQNGLGLALAHYRRGDAADARQWLKNSVDRLEQGTRDKGMALSFPSYFPDWITCRILRIEAEELIGKSGLKADASK
jgi:serine/threonine protein kinase/tetratricopeptide (TPR) repeat protein